MNSLLQSTMLRSVFYEGDNQKHESSSLSDMKRSDTSMVDLVCLGHPETLTLLFSWHSLSCSAPFRFQLPYPSRCFLRILAMYLKPQLIDQLKAFNSFGLSRALHVSSSGSRCLLSIYNRSQRAVSARGLCSINQSRSRSSG